MRWLPGVLVVLILAGCGGNGENKSGEISKKRLLDMINADRDANGVPDLVRHATLDEMAQEWANVHKEFNNGGGAPSPQPAPWSDIKAEVDSRLQTTTVAAEGDAQVIQGDGSISAAYNAFDNTWLMDQKWEWIGIGYVSYYCTTNGLNKQCYAWVIILVDPK